MTHYRRPPYFRRDRLGFVATMWLIIFGAIVGIAIVGSAHAHATSGHLLPVDVCGDLRHHVSLAQIENELEVFGFTQYTAGTYAGTVVRSQCPDLAGWVMGQVV